MTEGTSTVALAATPGPGSRAHLVERAAAAMGGLAGLNVPRPPPLPVPQVVGSPLAETHADLAPSDAPEGDQPENGTGRPDAAPAAARAPNGAAEAAPTIPLDALKQAGLAVAPVAGRSRISEEIGLVQHQVLRNLAAPKLADHRGGIVLVTSARPDEGKSFTSLNLAAALAQGGRPTVLVDADAKRGALGAVLGCSDLPGLRVLAEDPLRRPLGLLVRTALPRLLLLPYGVPGSNADALPSGTALANAVLRLAAAMPGAAIVVDTTPCLSTSEPGPLAAVAGQVLLVVEAEQTQRNEVEAALDMVDACPTLQLVLNKARLTANDTFGAYYGH